MKRARVLLLFGPLVLAGCIIQQPVGQDGTPRPWQVPSLAIGVTREADIISLYGQPTERSETTIPARRDSSTAATGIDVTLTFQSGQHVVFPKTVTSTTLRTTTFHFHDGVLSGYVFASPFPDDTRVIDFDRAEPILRQAGMMLSDLVPLIGAPQTKMNFQSQSAPVVLVEAARAAAKPLASKPSQSPPPTRIGEIDTWISTVRDGAKIISRETLTVTFDREGRLLRYARNLSNTVQ